MDLYFTSFVLLLLYAGGSEAYFLAQKAEETWSYDGLFSPENWYKLKMKNNQCGLDRQSPINVNTKTAKFTSDQLQLVNHNLTFFNLVLVNSGHNVNLLINHTGNFAHPVLYVTSPSGSSKFYCFNSLHYHFGDASTHGSEHQINGHKFPMEMHSVYFKFKYGSYENALNFEDGVIVVATLFKLDVVSNPRLAPLTMHLAEVAFPDIEVVIPQLYLDDLFPPHHTRYFTYQGSLTTPPCSRAVTWFIFQDMYPVSELQMQQFRQLTKHGEGEDAATPTKHLHQGRSTSFLADNVRPLQPLGNRPVYLHF